MLLQKIMYTLLYTLRRVDLKGGRRREKDFLNVKDMPMAGGGCP
jgi:hypothetical protein